MKPIFEPKIQSQIDAIERQIQRIRTALEDEFYDKLYKQTHYLDNALCKLLNENEVIGWDVNELEQIEINQMNEELDNG